MTQRKTKSVSLDDAIIALDASTTSASDKDAGQSDMAMLMLLAKIREACGDFGKRMQDELVTYIAQQHEDAKRYQALKSLVLAKESASPQTLNEQMLVDKLELFALATDDLLEDLELAGELTQEDAQVWKNRLRKLLNK